MKLKDINRSLADLRKLCERPLFTWDEVSELQTLVDLIDHHISEGHGLPLDWEIGFLRYMGWRK